MATESLCLYVELSTPGGATLVHPDLHAQKDEGPSPENGHAVPTGEGTDIWTSVAARLWAPPPL